MALDIFLEDHGPACVCVAGQTEAGDAFVDAWTGALLEVVDSGRIVIPREVAQEFCDAAARDGLTAAG